MPMYDRSIRHLKAGFTLIEMLVTISVMATLLAIGVPSFIATITSNRLTSQINDLVADISYARNESATRSARVAVCVSIDGTTCAAADTPWERGRIVFVDVNANGSRESAEPRLKVTPELTGASSLVLSGFPNAGFIRFRPFGGLDPATAGSFKLCSAASATGRQVSVGITGRPAAKQVACP